MAVKTIQDAPVPVTKDWFGPGNEQNKQPTHQTMMKKGWNRCPTQKQGDGADDAPRKVEWTCLGLHSMAMERSCSWSWRGVQRSQCSPKHNAFDSSGSHCLGDPPLPFLPQANQGQAMETPSARAHKQTTAQATIQEALQADVSRKTRVRHVLEDPSGDGYRRP